MIPKVPVKRIMSEKLLSLDQKESALKAAEIMTKHGTGSVLVTRDGEIFGIVSETDLIRKVLGQGMDPKKITLEAIMSYPPICVDERTMLEEACKLMGQNQIRHLVVTREGKPCGVISARNFMESLYP